MRWAGLLSHSLFYYFFGVGGWLVVVYFIYFTRILDIYFILFYVVYLCDDSIVSIVKRVVLLGS